MQELELHLANKPHKYRDRDFLPWIRAAWGLFKQRWGTWTLMLIALILINVLMGFIIGLLLPKSMVWLDQILTTPVSILLLGGWMIAAASLAEEDDLRFSYLFAGFQYKFKSLLILGLFFGVLITFITFFIVPLLLIFFMMGKIWLVCLSAFVLAVLVAACGMFAVPLVVLHDIAPHRAIGMSIHAFLRNWLPLLLSALVAFSVLLNALVFSLLLLTVAPVSVQGVTLPWLPAALPFMAVTLLFNYTSYRNIWTNLPMK